MNIYFIFKTSEWDKNFGFDLSFHVGMFCDKSKNAVATETGCNLYRNIIFLLKPPVEQCGRFLGQSCISPIQPKI